MASNISHVIQDIILDKGISEDLIKQTVEDSLLDAYKRTYGTTENAVVQFTDEGVILYAKKEIVEEVENPVYEIDLVKAQAINSHAEIGDQMLIKIDPQNFDRSAIQSAKQRTKQNLRDFQKDTLYSEFKVKEGELIIGYYQRERKGTIIVDLGKTEGILPRRFQNPRETYRPNDRIKALIQEVSKDTGNLQIVLSRTSNEFVQKIFELEVPEIYEKTVEIFKIVREPGYRTKIAVYSNRLDVDPVGACVGLKGVRIQAIVRELEGEKVDILKFASDPRELIQNALSPANINQVYILDEHKKHALAVVDEDQLSLAIGKQGLNVRLANKLVDWTIDIKTEEQFEEMDIAVANKQAVSDLFSDSEVEITRIAELPGISDRLVAILNRDNIEYIEDLLSINTEEMIQLDGITEEDVNFIQNIIAKNIIIEEDESSSEGETSDTELTVEDTSDDAEEDESDEITLISELPDIPEELVRRLEAGGLVEILSLLQASDDELRSIPNIEEGDIETIRRIIQDTIDIIEEE